MFLGVIIPKENAPYSHVDYIVAVFIFFVSLALTSDSEFNTLSKFHLPVSYFVLCSQLVP